MSRANSSDAARTRPGGRTRAHTEAIMAATLGLMATGGSADVTFQEVARLAGVSRTTMYRRWSSPAELVLDAVAFHAAQEISVPDAGSLAGDLAALLEQVAAWAESPTGSASIAAGLAVGLDSPSSARRTAGWDKRYAEMAVILRRAEERGEVRANLDHEAAFAMTAGAVYYRSIIMAKPVDQDWIDRVVSTSVESWR